MVVPSSCGHTSLTRRGREESNEERAASKRPRRSDERDSQNLQCSKVLTEHDIDFTPEHLAG